ncbi:MAG: hypothetical protein JWQ95_4017 [Sphaerisporangium sp.]|jgi:hypothetical protein|nr:hypothetical protein [Sphaerisporangium sp.]
MVKAMATRMVAAIGNGGPAWGLGLLGLGLLALAVLVGGTIEVPSGISWT